jgi:hypothetical protein
MNSITNSSLPSQVSHQKSITDDVRKFSEVREPSMRSKFGMKHSKTGLHFKSPSLDSDEQLMNQIVKGEDNNDI